MKTGFVSSLIQCDSKAIGTLYLVLAIVAGVIGAAFSIILRLAMNGVDIEFLNGASSSDPAFLSFVNMAHALILVFFMVMPALIGGFANWFVPLLIGTQNIAFPRLNILAFILLPLSILAVFSAIFSIGNANVFAALLLASIYLGSVSFVLTFVNFIATIITMRAPGMSLAHMPIFVWSVLISAFLGVMSVPAMLAALTQLVFSGDFGNAELPMMVWFFSHPEIYVLLLPAFGIVSQIFTTFCNRPLWMEKAVVAAMVAIGTIGFVLWSNDLFQVHKPQAMERYFYVALPLIALPTGFILLSWFMTLIKSRFTFQTPMLWSAGFFFTVLMGLVSALQLAFSTSGVNGFDSSAFVAHFHYILSLGAVFAIFAGWYYWLPKMTGFSCRAATAKLHFWMMFVGVNAIFLPQHLRQLIDGAVSGMPFMVAVSSIGAILAGSSVLVFLYGVCETFIRRQKATRSPWGEGAQTLEWQLPSPPEQAWIRVPRISR